ncbi:G-protein coupled receptor 83-like [Topomyia yanbarensis]|uniref:G-protein coupled receptor 83-like n=1 Tax=Topomyia yanbarensis TaxID=2498891 RepID=UPI00273C2CCB|nr:G-protein coupled receptor 83-like [Topomyia yanbarensis]
MAEFHLSTGAAMFNRSLVYLELVAVSSSTATLPGVNGSGSSSTTTGGILTTGFDLIGSSTSALLVSQQPGLDGNETGGPSNEGGLVNENFGTKADPICIILPITIFYCFIFVAGILGNLAICIVIAKNRSMHTATNYYLFNLAVSDFLLLLFGE